MEFILKLISAKRLATKAFPLLIILCGMVLFVDSIAHWSSDGNGVFCVDILKIIAVVPVIILFVDTLFITLIERCKASMIQLLPEYSLREINFE